VIYAAASIGGIWKSEDGGQSWRSLVDQQVPLIYGGLVMHPDNPDSLYALLGEFDGSVAANYGFLANGIMHSEDAGETWTLLGADVFDGASVTALVFDEDGAMYASSGQSQVWFGPPGMPEFGIFRSEDGGQSWDRLLSCTDVGPCLPEGAGENTSYAGGFFDLDIASDGTLFTSHCVLHCWSTSILRSRDGGDSWEQLDIRDALQTWQEQNEVYLYYLDDAGQYPVLDGFEIAVAPSDPNIVIAGGGMEWYTADNESGYWSWAIRSTDGGDTWEWMPDAGDYCTAGGGSPQCSYDNIVEIDPNDPDIMYLGGSFSREQETYNWVAVMRRSTDGGNTWTDLTPAVEGSFMHPDAHGMAFDPTDSNVIWVGNDGGIYKTDDVSAEPPEWIPMSDGLNTLLFIDVALHPTDPDYLIGGLQDNAKAFTTDRDSWEGAASGDGAYVAVDPFEPEIVYGTIYPPTIFERNHNSGEGGYEEWSPPGWGGGGYTEGLDGEDNWAFYPYFTVDPNNDGVVYIVSNRVYRSDNRGDEWFPISPYLTDDPRGIIQSFTVAPSDSDVLYAGLSVGTLFASFDGGDEWVDITGPDFPARSVQRIAVHPKTLRRPTSSTTASMCRRRIIPATCSCRPTAARAGKTSPLICPTRR
jgi:photosystem II stability/assembly factor-like uncharacterized protein